MPSGTGFSSKGAIQIAVLGQTMPTAFLFRVTGAEANTYRYKGTIVLNRFDGVASNYQERAISIWGEGVIIRPQGEPALPFGADYNIFYYARESGIPFIWAF